MIKRLFFRKAGLIGPALLFTAIAMGMYQEKSSLTDSFVQMDGSAGSVIKCDYNWSIHKYETYILTANHVAGERIIKIKFPLFDKNGHQYTHRKYGGRVIVSNEVLDFAIVLVNIDLYVKPVTVNISNLKLMDSVCLIGRPLNAQLWITEGKIANLNLEKHVGYFGVNAPVFMGNSGGPCLNSEKEQIGIVVGMYSHDEIFFSNPVPHMGICVSIRVIQKYYPREFRRYFASVKG